MYWNLRDKGLLTISKFFTPITLNTWAFVALTVATTVVGGITSRNQAKAQTKQIEMNQRANASAIDQAEKDKQREIDMAVYQEERQARREEGNAKAGQANAGIAGITASRQIDNALFQSMLNENYIKTQGENAMINLSNQGFQQSNALQTQLNTSKRNTPSTTGIAMSAGIAGVNTYAIRDSAKTKKYYVGD